MERKTYSLVEKKTALLALQDNEFRWAKTARQIGISVQTLRNWNKLLGKSVFDKDYTSEAVVSTMAGIQMEESAAIRGKGETVAGLALDKMKEKIESDQVTTKELIDLIKVIFPHITPKLAIGETGDNPTKVSNFTQNILMNMSNK